MKSTGYRARTTRPLHLLLVLVLLATCGAGELPDGGQQAVVSRISELVGDRPAYELISAQKATASDADFDVQVDSPFNANPGVCPPSLGGAEAWCVVISPPLTAANGVRFSRLLVSRTGQDWQAEALSDDQIEVFFSPAAITGTPLIRRPRCWRGL